MIDVNAVSDVFALAWYWFRRERVTLLVVERLVAVRSHVVHVEHEAMLAVSAHAPGIEVHVEQPCVERAVRERPVQQAIGIQRSRQQAHRPSVGRGSDGRRRSGAAVEHRGSYGLGREECP